MEEALYLSNLASNVTLIHRRDQLRAEKILQDRLLKKENINIIWNSEVTEICGENAVESVKLLNSKTNGEQEVFATGCFVAIGHDPATEVFHGQVEMDEDGYILVEPGTTRTNKPGLFAAGDCVDRVYRQAVTAAGLGCMSALEVEKYLADLES